MNGSAKSSERNSEIITFFYKIFGHRIHEGMSPDEARKQAYDAVALRYEISSGRLLNIISEHKKSLNVNESRLRQNALALINDLQAVNAGLGESISKNERLISILKECLEND